LAEEEVEAVAEQERRLLVAEVLAVAERVRTLLVVEEEVEVVNILCTCYR
jgi:hypothetical protein